MSRIDDLYERFERRFRGDRELVLRRLSQYEPLLVAIEARTTSRIAIDYGCGRGEWIELLKRRGWTANGVDTNGRMIDEAARHGVDVVRADAIAHLSTLADRSVQLVSAFHLAEHLPTELLLMLLGEMNRVLTDDGVILLETPNPENLTVGTSSFYLDPTHRKPLPPELLRFYLEQSGSRRAFVIRLNGDPDAAAIETLEAAIRPLFYRSLDYAAIGVRDADEPFVAAIERFVASVDQGSPIDLLAVRRLDETNARNRDSVQAAERALQSLVIESRDILHGAVEAVYNTTLPLAERLAVVESGQAEARESYAALHNASLAVAGRVDGGLASLSAQLDSLRLVAEESVRRLDAVQGRVAATWVQIDKSSKLVQMSMREELAAARRTLDAREARHAHALDALRRSNADVQTRVDDALLQQVRADADRRIAEAVAAAVDRTADVFRASTSWRITAPLRAAIDLSRRSRGSAERADLSATAVAPATDRPPRAGSSGEAAASPARRGVLANRHVWRAGKHLVRFVPGMRARVLRSMDRNNLLSNPLNDVSIGVVPETTNAVRVPAYLPTEDVTEEMRVMRMPGDAQRLYLRFQAIQRARFEGGG